MKNIYKIVIPIAGMAAFMLFTAELNNGSGSPGGKTGSPGDGNATCTQCHGGTASAQTGWITTNIPATGWIPGQTYTITATLTHSGANRYGFELTAENSTGTKTGTFSLINASETKLTNAGKAVSHTFSGTTGAGGSKTWTANWQAPVSGTGTVSFYAAFNAANGNGTTSGDVIYTSSLMVPEAITASVPSNPGLAAVKLFPNPATETVYLTHPESQEGIVYQILDLSGKIWKSGISKGTETEIAVDGLPRGIYLMTSGLNEKVFRLVLR